MGALMLLTPGERPLVVHEACGIRWDDNDRLRFLSKCKWVGRCLIWQGAKSRGGPHRAAGRKAGNKKWYGSFTVKGKTVRAHKFAAVAFHGFRPGPADEIDHRCYNTLCVFCLECVPKEVNQGRIRRGARNAEGNIRQNQVAREAEGGNGSDNGAGPSIPTGPKPRGGAPCS